MKTNVFSIMLALLFAGTLHLHSQHTGTGVDWDSNPPSSPIVVDENFQGFEFFHSDEHPDQGNSNNSLDEDGETILWGYVDSMEITAPIVNGGGGTVGYKFIQCAFAPEWMAAWAYRDLNATGTGENTRNVSNGFVEVSREYGGAVPTIPGYFQIDLRSINFVDMVQWTHSSCGGRRRGVLLEISLDDGASWDTLRYQPGDAGWSNSFTRDPFTGEDTPNTFNCEPSAYGMTWAEAVYSENVMLRFKVAGGQVPRIHDFKVYGEYIVNDLEDAIRTQLDISIVNKHVQISEIANLKIYNINGELVKTGNQVRSISMESYPRGVYLVKVELGNHGVKTQKIMLK